MLGKLLKRRVPQIAGLYLAGSWGFVQFVDWAVGQYVLSPRLTNFVVVLLILLLPSVLLLAWRFGARGDDRWTRKESIAVPLNVVVAVTILFVVFRGEPLGAATTTVTVEDETGSEVQRVVPRDKFRRSVAMFFFENATGDTIHDWLRYGLPLATEMDLSQDMFIRVASPWSDAESRLLDELERAGFEDGLGAPLTLMRELALNQHVDVLLTGSLVHADSALVVESELYDVPRGRRIAGHTFEGTDPFELADGISEQLKRDLELPTLQIDEAEDLPAAEILTRSVSAYREFTLGMRALLDNDLTAAQRWLSGAAEEDPTFAWAQWTLSAAYYYGNQRTSAQGPREAALQHLYKLPERIRLQVLAMDYSLFQQKPEQALKAVRYLVELYPHDLEGRGLLAELHRERGEWEQQVEQLEAILSIDPSRHLLLEIGSIYQGKARYEEALGYFQRYAELFPGDHDSFVAIGELHRLTGEHELAETALEQALLLEPGDASVMAKLLRVNRDLGRFETAQEWAEKAVAARASPADRVEVYALLETLYYRQGRFAQVEENHPEYVAAVTESNFPLNVALIGGQSLALQYAYEVGREAAAFSRFDSLRAGLPPPWDDAFGFLYGVAAAEAGDLERAREELERADRGIAALGFEVAVQLTEYGSGRVNEQEGDCEAAVEAFRRALSRSPGDIRYLAALGRCQRDLGELEEAEATLQSVLKVVPAEAKVRYELALVYEEIGRRADAIQQLERATEIWKDADPDYRPAGRARAKLAELQATNS
jgi:tetratricopeptide (TPR) repeat protein